MSAISIPIISDFNPKGIDRAVREFQKLETAGQKAQFAIKKAAVPAAMALGVLANFAGDALKAFMEDDRAAQVLATSLKNTTGATDAQVKAVEKFITKTSIAAAVSDNELRPALDSLVRATGDVAKAQELLNLALDISAGTGKDLGAVSDALSKAFNGQLGPLKKLDPALASLIKNGATTDEIFAALSSTFNGAASTSANTASGKMKSFAIQMDEFKESVGAAVAPILEELMPAFKDIADWISNNVGLVVGLGVSVGVLATAIFLTNAAMSAWAAISAITAAVNAVTASSFTALWVATGIGIIVAIVAAVALLIIKFGLIGKIVDGITWAFKKLWAIVSAIFSPLTAVIGGIADAVGSFFGWFSSDDEKKIVVFADDMKLARKETDSFKESIKQARIDALTPLARAAKVMGEKFEEWIVKPARNANVEINKLKHQWDILTGALSTTVAIDTVKQQLEDLKAAAALAFASGSQKDIADYRQKLLDTLTSLQGITNGLDIVSQKAIKILVDTGDLEGAIKLIDLINGNNVLIGKASMAANASGHGLYIPHMANGGIVTGPTLAMIGEGNGPEAVIPLNKLGSMGGGSNITVNVNGGDPNSIVRALQQYVRQSGPVPVNIRAM